MRWYAVYTKPQLELWARTNLWERGFEVYLPQYARRRSHARKVEMVRAPLFPRYLFLRADLAQTGKAAINTAPGAIGLVNFGGEPASVADAVIEEIRGREKEDGLVQLVDGARLKLNDRLRITDGALCGHVGIFLHMADRDRAVLLLDLLGRQVRAQLPAKSLRREL